MATQAFSTYDTKRVSLITNLMQRSGSSPTKDARLVNMMVETVPNQVEQHAKAVIRSRPGVTAAYTLSTGTARGIYYWLYEGTGHVISVVGSNVYVNGTVRGTLATATGEVGFTEFVNDVGVVTLVMVDGTNGYTFATPSDTPVQITAVDFPTPHIPNPIFLDGYLFLAKSGTQDVYNSNLNDPSLWTAGEYLSAEMYPDKIVALTKNNNYLYAVGSNSIEYMYDAANPTGTPLARHAAAVQQFGTPAPMTVVPTEKEVILVGETGNGGHTVWVIEGFKSNEIGIPAVKFALLTEGSSLPNATGYCIRAAGQKLYVLSLTSRTFVYSFDTQMWCEWASGTTSTIKFIGSRGTNGTNGKAYLLDYLGRYVYTISIDSLSDNGTSFRCEVVTARLDFDMINRKFMSRFSLIGDVTTTGTTFSVDWTDDDYVTWSTARSITFDYDFPVLTQLGAFRRRAFRIRYTSPHLIRLDGLELDINKGAQ